MGLTSKPSYGYELISTIRSYGFIQGDIPPGMIYRHLRQMEEDYLVQSKRDTAQAGPAKRSYTITQEGEDVLIHWIKFMTDKARRLKRFVQMFENTIKVDFSTGFFSCLYDAEFI